MTQCFQLDPVTGDLARVRGRLVRADNVAQRLRTRLAMFQGEWFLDVSDGTPFLQTILIQNVNLAHVRTALTARVRETEGVTSIQSLDLGADLVRRKLAVSIVAIGPSGQVQVQL